MSELQHTVETTCKFCRRRFSSFGLTKVCSECDANMSSYFQSIREYLEKFPNASIAEICDALDMPSALIKYYFKEKKLK